MKSMYKNIKIKLNNIDWDKEWAKLMKDAFYPENKAK